MGGKREKPRDIVLKLRQVEVLQGQGKPLADAVDLSRFSAAPSSRLSHFPFESDGAFPAQC